VRLAGVREFPSLAAMNPAKAITVVAVRASPAEVERLLEAAGLEAVGPPTLAEDSLLLILEAVQADRLLRDLEVDRTGDHPGR
jgi:hypothetical protein